MFCAVLYEFKNFRVFLVLCLAVLLIKVTPATDIRWETRLNIQLTLRLPDLTKVFLSSMLSNYVHF